MWLNLKDAMVKGNKPSTEKQMSLNLNYMWNIKGINSEKERA